MMTLRSFLASIAVCTLVLLLALPVHGQGGIVVNGADTTRQVNVNGLDPGLGAVAGSVRSRVVLENANTQRQAPLAVPSSVLQGLFGQVLSRVTFQFANSSRYAGLASPPGALQSLLSAVRPRVVFDGANSSRFVTLSYPVALVGDSTPPQVSAVASSRQGSTATVGWTTNEFATSAVLYGTQSGNLTQTITDPLYVKQHETALTGLTPGVAYYYRVRSVDLSGNPTLSQERVLQGQSYLFVPSVQRSR